MLRDLLNQLRNEQPKQPGQTGASYLGPDFIELVKNSIEAVPLEGVAFKLVVDHNDPNSLWIGFGDDSGIKITFSEVNMTQEANAAIERNNN